MRYVTCTALCTLALAFGSRVTMAQDQAAIAADPAALKTFTELVKSYRDRPALTIKSTVTVGLKEGEAAAKGSDVKAEFIFGKNRKAVIKLRGFTCYLNHVPDAPDGGTITSIHEGNKDSYYSGSDQGSPYYALLNEFRDMPFPELAIMLGEDAIDDVLLQFHPKALNGVVPTAINTKEIEGKSVQTLILTGEHETIDVLINPETKLINSIELRSTSGALVQAGAHLTYRHTYEYEIHAAPIPDSTFVFDPGQRQRVDLMASLLPKPTRIQPIDGDEENGGVPAHTWVGKKAPTFVLSTADGKAVDLEELDGRVVILDFWASWCGPCMSALPKLHDVAKWATEQEMPVTVLTINVWEVRGDDDTPDARLKSATETWQKRHFTLPILMDYTDETAMSYGVRGIPTTFIIRADGMVHAEHTGAGPDYVEQLKSEIQEALKAVE